VADKVVPTGLVTPVNGSSLCSDLGLSGGPEVAEPVSVEEDQIHVPRRSPRAGPASLKALSWYVTEGFFGGGQSMRGSAG